MENNERKLIRRAVASPGNVEKILEKLADQEIACLQAEVEGLKKVWGDRLELVQQLQQVTSEVERLKVERGKLLLDLGIMQNERDAAESHIAKITQISDSEMMSLLRRRAKHANELEQQLQQATERLGELDNKLVRIHRCLEPIRHIIEEFGSDEKLCDAIQSRLSPLMWTTEKPTKPGWYWYKGQYRLRLPIVREVAHSDLQWGILPNHGKWSGPFSPPPERQR